MLIWADIILNQSGTMRQRGVGGLSWRNLSSLGSTSISFASPTSTQPRIVAHELVDTSIVIRAAALEKQKTKRGPKTKSENLCLRKGKCAYAECPVAQPGYTGLLVKRPTTRCNACKEGSGAYYHMPCFFAVHSCRV